MGNPSLTFPLVGPQDASYSRITVVWPTLKHAISCPAHSPLLSNPSLTFPLVGPQDASHHYFAQQCPVWVWVGTRCLQQSLWLPPLPPLLLLLPLLRLDGEGAGS